MITIAAPAEAAKVPPPSMEKLATVSVLAILILIYCYTKEKSDRIGSENA